MNTENKTFLISRTDKIGDVILTLPLASFLKKHFKSAKVIFLCSTYTKPIVKCCSDIDEIIEVEHVFNLSASKQIDFFKKLNIDVFLHVFPNKEIAYLAFKANIPIRIGTSHKFYHFLYANFRVNFSRKNSDLHESQLNFMLLKPLGISFLPDLTSVYSFLSFSNIYEHDDFVKSFIDKNRINLIFHPMSNGSAVEWPMRDYVSLCNLLSEKKFNIIFAGTKKDREMYEPYLKGIKGEFKDAGGALSLEQYVSLIDLCDGLIAASTGPLHIASVLNKFAFGIYLEKRPVHSGRWAPIGINSVVFKSKKSCSKCLTINACNCIESISPDEVSEEILKKFST